MPQTLHEKLDSLGDGQVRTLDEIERSSRENLVMARSIRESLAAQTEVLRTQAATLEALNRQIERDGRRRAEEAASHDAHIEELSAKNDAQHEMFRLAMVQLLDRLSGE